MVQFFSELCDHRHWGLACLGFRQHWAASDANDFETEHRIYLDDAVLEYPQSGERTRGRSNIRNQRASQPNKKRFSIRRIIGSGALWVTEFILTYDGKPSYTVSIMEFTGDKVARETQPSLSLWECGRGTEIQRDCYFAKFLFRGKVPAVITQQFMSHSKSAFRRSPQTKVY